MGVIFLGMIGYVKKPAIRQKITSVTLLLRLGKLLYLLCYAIIVTRLCTRCDLVALSMLSSPLGGIRNLSAKLVLLLHHVND